MPITPEQLIQMQQRLAPKVRFPVPEDAVEDEGGLHDEILKWIREQVPQPAYIHSRMDKKSTANKGVPDFIILWKKKVILPECKTRTGKRSPFQLAWALLAEMNGFKVCECRSFGQFLKIVDESPELKQL